MASSRPEVFRRTAELAQASTANTLRFPSKPNPHSILLVFKKYDYSRVFGNTNDANQALRSKRLDSTRRTSRTDLREEISVELPFPKQLVDNTNLNINGFSRDPLMEKLVTGIEGALNGGGDGTLGGLPQGLQAAGAALAGAVAGGSNGMSTLKTSLSNMGIDDASNAAKYLLQKFGGMLGDSGQSINLASGSVLNPRETLAFEGVQLRQHNFSWELYPSNRADSAQIKDIILSLKRCVLPETQNFALGNMLNVERAFLKYPHICYPYLIGVDQHSFITFKPCMVTSLTVDYAGGGGLSMLKGGKPAGVTLGLALQELAIETAHDYGAASNAAVNVDVDQERFNNSLNSDPLTSGDQAVSGGAG